MAIKPKKTTGTTAPKTTTQTTTPKTYVVRAGDTGYNADIANKAQAYLTGGAYNAGQAIDTNWWGAGGGKAQMYGNNKTYKGQAMTANDMQKASYYAQLYDQAQTQRQQDQMWDEIYARQQQQYEAEQEAARQRTQQTVSSIKANVTDINDAYQEAQRQAYINQALQRSQMGDYLSANGFTGGMAESTLAQLSTNYENNRRNATSERDAALRQNEQLIAQARASGDLELASIASTYANNSIAAMQNQAQMNYQLAQAQQDQRNADREYQLAYMQQKQAQKQYEDQLAANKAEQDFNTFLDTYKGKYNNKSTYENWIKNLKALDDPYGYNRQKIAYITQYLNSGMGNNAAAAGGAASVYINPSGNVNTDVYAGTKTDAQSGPQKSTTSYSYDTLKYNMTNALLKGATKAQLKTFVDPIKAAYDAGNLTEAQANELLKMLGAI